MCEEGVTEVGRARRKAAERTGIADRRCWPGNEEIEDALLLQRRLFADDARTRELDGLRRQALEAMRQFGAFEPRLVGQLLHGAGVPERGIQLHLHAESPDDVVHAMLEFGIPWTQRDLALRYPGGDQRIHPSLSFVAGTTPVDIIVLPRQAKRSPPLSPVTERPERGLPIEELERLVASADPRPRASEGSGG